MLIIRAFSCCSVVGVDDIWVFKIYAKMLIRDYAVTSEQNFNDFGKNNFIVKILIPRTWFLWYL